MAIVIVLIMIDLIVVGLTLGQGRDHNLTIARMETVEASYASEAGMNMSMRELMFDRDEDDDDSIGAISDDGNDANDPTLGNAQFRVTSSYDPVADETTLTSEGRSGNARRIMSTVMGGPPP